MMPPLFVDVYISASAHAQDYPNQGSAYLPLELNQIQNLGIPMYKFSKL